jgi:PIN domain
VRIQPGITVAKAIEVLEDIINRSAEPQNVLTGLTVTGFAELASRPEYGQALKAYLNWVNSAQAMLRSVFASAELSDALMSRAYWHICNFHGPVTTFSRLIGEELVYQAGHPGITGDPTRSQLGQAVAQLRALSYLADRPGKICVPDTNVMMHYKRFDEFDWSSRLGVPLVRLVIPVTVVAEIDNKKYARRSEFWDRARDLLALIDSYADGSPDGYAAVRQGVTVEILPDEEGHLRLPDIEQEIRDRCELLHQVTNKPVTLVTGDSAARINARMAGVEVFMLTRDDLLPRYRPELAQGPAVQGQTADYAEAARPVARRIATLDVVLARSATTLPAADPDASSLPQDRP